MARKLKGDHGPSKRRLAWEYLVAHDFEPLGEMIEICKSTNDPRLKFDMAATIAGFFYAKPKAVEHKMVDDHKVTVTIGGVGGLVRVRCARATEVTASSSGWVHYKL